MDVFVATLFLIVCVLLVIVILLQKGRGGGLGSAFGGAASSAFGTRTGDVFTWVTIVLVGVFLLLAVATTLRFRPPQTEPVETPTFYPLSKAIDRDIHVTITSKTTGAEIFFSIGTEDRPPPDPTPRSLPYEAAVRVRPGAVIKARAYLRGWKPSKIGKAEYPRASTTQPSTQPAAGEPPRATNPPPATSATH